MQLKTMKELIDQNHAAITEKVDLINKLGIDIDFENQMVDDNDDGVGMR